MQKCKVSGCGSGIASHSYGSQQPIKNKDRFPHFMEFGAWGKPETTMRWCMVILVNLRNSDCEESRQFTDKTVHRHGFLRQFTDRIEDSSPTLLKTVHWQNFILYLYSIMCIFFFRTNLHIFMRTSQGVACANAYRSINIVACMKGFLCLLTEDIVKFDLCLK